jgi:hypothetical protein
MTSSPATEATATDPNPSHDEIAQCARELWMESGQPEGRDDAIWFEAERRVVSERRAPREAVVVQPTPASQPSQMQPHGRKDRRSGRHQKYVM